MTPVLYAKGDVKTRASKNWKKNMLILHSSVSKGDTYASIRRSCIK